MKSPARYLILCAALACVIGLAGCSAAAPDEAADKVEQPAPQTQTTDSADVSEPADFYDELKVSGYTGWTPAPGNESRVAAKGPHGDEVQILLDPTAEQGLASGGDRWPLGSIIAKDIFQDGKLVQIAAMKKTAKGWYWGEWDAQGKPVVEGLAAEPCEGCHKDGTDGTLGVALK